MTDEEKPWLITKEDAVEKGRKGGQRAAELRKLRAEDPEAYAFMRFELKKGRLTNELLQAALGEGKWKDLPLDKRLTAVMKALEYAVGKPTAGKSTGNTEPDEEPAKPGIVIE